MSLKELWQEHREEQKLKKIQKKQKKKEKLTHEQKVYKIFGILLGCFVTFGALFSTCSNFSTGVGDFSWNKLVGISDEYVAELEKPINESTLFPNGRIGKDELSSLEKKFQDCGLDILLNDDFDESELENGSVVISDLYLTARELGALVNEVLVSINYIKVCDMSITFENDIYIQKSIVYVNLNELIADVNLPKIYVTTISEAIVLNGTLAVLNSDIKVNQVSEKLNDKIIEMLDSNSSIKMSSIGNSFINSTIQVFSESVFKNFVLKDEGLLFKAS